MSAGNKLHVKLECRLLLALAACTALMNMKPADWSVARKHLEERDPVMRDIMAAVGPCTLSVRRDHFVLLCKSIYSQQISSAVAAVLFGRFREKFPNKRPTPGAC